MIESFHKILKSGYKVEDCRLMDAESLRRYLTVMSITSWRIGLLVKFGRAHPEIVCTHVFTDHEWQVLYMRVFKTKTPPSQAPMLGEAMQWVAKLGGYHNSSGPPPGVTTIWRGWSKLETMVEFYESCMLH